MLYELYIVPANALGGSGILSVKIGRPGGARGAGRGGFSKLGATPYFVGISWGMAGKNRKFGQI